MAPPPATILQALQAGYPGGRAYAAPSVASTASSAYGMLPYGVPLPYGEQYTGGEDSPTSTVATFDSRLHSYLDATAAAAADVASDTAAPPPPTAAAYSGRSSRTLGLGPRAETNSGSFRSEATVGGWSGAVGARVGGGRAGGGVQGVRGTDEGSSLGVGYGEGASTGARPLLPAIASTSTVSELPVPVEAELREAAASVAAAAGAAGARTGVGLGVGRAASEAAAAAAAAAATRAAVHPILGSLSRQVEELQQVLPKEQPPVQQQHEQHHYQQQMVPEQVDDFMHEAEPEDQHTAGRWAGESPRAAAGEPLSFVLPPVITGPAPAISSTAQQLMPPEPVHWQPGHLIPAAAGPGAAQAQGGGPDRVQATISTAAGSAFPPPAARGSAPWMWRMRSSEMGRTSFDQRPRSYVPAAPAPVALNVPVTAPAMVTVSAPGPAAAVPPPARQTAGVLQQALHSPLLSSGQRAEASSAGTAGVVVHGVHGTQRVPAAETAGSGGGIAAAAAPAAGGVPGLPIAGPPAAPIPAHAPFGGDGRIGAAGGVGDAIDWDVSGREEDNGGAGSSRSSRSSRKSSSSYDDFGDDAPGGYVGGLTRLMVGAAGGEVEPRRDQQGDLRRGAALGPGLTGGGTGRGGAQLLARVPSDMELLPPAHPGALGDEGSGRGAGGAGAGGAGEAQPWLAVTGHNWELWGLGDAGREAAGVGVAAATAHDGADVQEQGQEQGQAAYARPSAAAQAPAGHAAPVAATNLAGDTTMTSTPGTRIRPGADAATGTSSGASGTGPGGAGAATAIDMTGASGNGVPVGGGSGSGGGGGLLTHGSVVLGVPAAPPSVPIAIGIPVPYAAAPAPAPAYPPAGPMGPEVSAAGDAEPGVAVMTEAPAVERYPVVGPAAEAGRRVTAAVPPPPLLQLLDPQPALPGQEAVAADAAPVAEQGLAESDRADSASQDAGSGSDDAGDQGSKAIRVSRATSSTPPPGVDMTPLPRHARGRAHEAASAAAAPAGEAADAALPPLAAGPDHVPDASYGTAVPPSAGSGAQQPLLVPAASDLGPNPLGGIMADGLSPPLYLLQGQGQGQTQGPAGEASPFAPLGDSSLLDVRPSVELRR